MRILLGLLVCLVLTAGCVGPTTSVVTVRHAEKQRGVPDPALTAEGQRRAEALRERLLTADIQAVYSTDTRRTRATAAPLAAALGLPVLLYRTPSQIAAMVRAQHRGQAVLVVAHSNTLGLIVDAFGADRPDPVAGTIAENDYDNMVTIFIDGRGQAGAVHTTYGVASP